MYVLIHNGTLIDGNGDKPIDNAVVLIKDNKILECGSENSIQLPEGEIKRVNAQGGFILPGFIDCHVHMMWNGFHYEDSLFTPVSTYFYNAAEYLRLTLDAGVTTVRDAGMADYGVKMAVENGLIVGPRLQISVMPLSITGGHFDMALKSGQVVKTNYPGLPDAVCDGTEEVRKRVREVLRAGADWVKVMVTGGVISANDSPEHPQFTLDELKIMVEEASYRDLKVMAHAHGAQGVKNALNVGITSIEHGTYLDQECIDLLVENDAWLIPTQLAHWVNLELLKAGKLPDFSQEDARTVAMNSHKNMEKAYQAGVKMVMGTDSGIAPHGQNLRELGFLNDIGMKPMEAIQAGTKKAAEFLQMEDKIGTIEKGKLADVVISKTNPLKDIHTLGNPENIAMVMKEGKIFKNTF